MFEADKIYQAIFREVAPDILKRRFVEASSRLHDRSDKKELDRYYRAIQKISDLEALEIACRYTRRLPLLSTKFNMMVYIAETIPENQHFFINYKKNVLKGWLTIFNGTVRTAFKLGKGLFLLIRIRNA